MIGPDMMDCIPITRWIYSPGNDVLALTLELLPRYFQVFIILLLGLLCDYYHGCCSAVYSILCSRESVNRNMILQPDQSVTEQDMTN